MNKLYISILTFLALSLTGCSTPMTVSPPVAPVASQTPLVEPAYVIQFIPRQNERELDLGFNYSTKDSIYVVTIYEMVTGKVAREDARTIQDGHIRIKLGQDFNWQSVYRVEVSTRATSFLSGDQISTIIFTGFFGEFVGRQLEGDYLTTADHLGSNKNPVVIGKYYWDVARFGGESGIWYKEFAEVPTAEEQRVITSALSGTEIACGHECVTDKRFQLHFRSTIPFDREIVTNIMVKYGFKAAAFYGPGWSAPVIAIKQ